MKDTRPIRHIQRRSIRRIEDIEAKERCNTIERLQQGESLNVQDVKTNLFWEFRKFTSRDGESMESYYSRFYKLMNELTRNNLQVTTMQVNVQFLQQLQPNGPRFAKSANPLALLAAAQRPYSYNYYQAPKPQRTNTTSSSTRPSASTRHKGKGIAKPVTPQSESVSEEDSAMQSECRKPKRVKDYSINKEKMMMSKQAEALDVPLQLSNADWQADKD
ncbi:hypothetical protein Tco_0331202 [Tanacetum coccineum]